MPVIIFLLQVVSELSTRAQFFCKNFARSDANIAIYNDLGMDNDYTKYIISDKQFFLME
jgi:hypothetical protein